MLFIFKLLPKWTTVLNKTTMNIENVIFNEFSLKSHEILPGNLFKSRIEKIDSSEKSADGKFHRADFKLIIEYNKRKMEFLGEIMNSDSSASFNFIIEKILFLKKEKASGKYLILARYLNHLKQKECKERGINFIDLSGNVYIAEDRIYIEKLQNKNLSPDNRKNRSPFSDKASLLIRKLLYDKQQLWGIRELANSIGLDPGFVSRIVSELQLRNYIIKIDSQIKLINREQILKDWVENYSSANNVELKYFSPGKNVKEILECISKISFDNANNPDYALSFQAGANLVYNYSAYDVVHVYVRNLESIDQFKELNLIQVDKGENIIFMLPYYKKSVFFDRQIIKDLWVVSNLQLYLDIYNYPLRGREQAEKIYEVKLKKLLNIN
jgi:DNA-binding Lrp family transcriptional regulator